MIGCVVFNCFNFHVLTFLLWMGAKYYDEYVCFCLFVCLPICLHILKTTWSDFTKWFVHFACGCGLVLLWWCCDMLCTSGFVDDILFLCNGPCYVSCIPSGKSVTGKTTASVAQSWRSVSAQHGLHTGVKSAVYDCLAVVDVVLWLLWCSDGFKCGTW